MNFIKKWNVVFLFSSVAHWNKGAASKIAVILWPYHVLLCYHFCCFLCEGVLLDRTPKPLFWEQERPVGELCWVLPGALPQQPSLSPSCLGQTGALPTCLPERAWLINSRMALCGQVKNYFGDLESIPGTLCIPTAGWSPVEDSQFRTFLCGSHCNINGVTSSEQNNARCALCPHTAHNCEAIHAFCKLNSRPKLTYNHSKAYPFCAV